MAQSPYFIYITQPADTLSVLLLRLYEAAPWSRRRHELRRAVVHLNPQLKEKDLDRLPPGTPLTLADFSQLTAAVTPPLATFGAPHQTADHQGLWAMAWAEHSGLLTHPGSVALGAGAHLLGRSNLALLQQVGDEYAAYRQGQITKGQYDHRRRQLIELFRSKAGPFERLLFRGLKTPQAIRIARHGALPHDHHIRQQTGRLEKLRGLATQGGLVLTAVGLSAACTQIAQSVDRQIKNEVFIDAIVSSIFGTSLGIFAVSNPVGWGTALVLALGASAVSLAAGKLAVSFYDTAGAPLDLVSGLGIDRLCRP